MKILVTGATGFIGNYVVKKIIAENHQVIASARDKERAEKFEWFHKVHFVEWDFDKGNVGEVDLMKYFDYPELLIHLAWQGLPNFQSQVHIENNLMSNYFFLKNLIENGLKDLTVAGTCLEYGMQSGKMNENMPAMPVTAYAVAKDSLRRFLFELNKIKTFDLKWVRLFYMYGEGQHAKSLIPQLESALSKGENIFDMSGGEQVRDYLAVEKVAEYIVRIAMQKKISGVINCCSGKPIKVRELVETYLKNSGKQIQLHLGHYPYNDYEPMEFWGDDKKLLSIIK
jgi:dTDP-6-deoxy-L-talose 4-dehydrogenase (NAD+)